MQPTGMPGLALISAYWHWRVRDEQGEQLLAAGRQLPERPAPFGREQQDRCLQPRSP